MRRPVSSRPTRRCLWATPNHTTHERPTVATVRNENTGSYGLGVWHCRQRVSPGCEYVSRPSANFLKYFPPHGPTPEACCAVVGCAGQQRVCGAEGYVIHGVVVATSRDEHFTAVGDSKSDGVVVACGGKGDSVGSEHLDSVGCDRNLQVTALERLGNYGSRRKYFRRLRTG